MRLWSLLIPEKRENQLYSWRNMVTAWLSSVSFVRLLHLSVTQTYLPEWTAALLLIPKEACPPRRSGCLRPSRLYVVEHYTFHITKRLRLTRLVINRCLAPNAAKQFSQGCAGVWELCAEEMKILNRQKETERSWNLECPMRTRLNAKPFYLKYVQLRAFSLKSWL